LNLTTIGRIARQQRQQFFGRPTRGGKLTILNCILWAIVFSAGSVGIAFPEPIAVLAALLLSPPLATPFLLPGGGRSFSDAIASSVAVGVNSVLWGYGISWLFAATFDRAAAKKRAEDLRRCLSCGYDLRATPKRCPECGTEVAPTQTNSATAWARPPSRRP
jgi:hypothetical protein